MRRNRVRKVQPLVGGPRQLCNAAQAEEGVVGADVVEASAILQRIARHHRLAPRLVALHVLPVLHLLEVAMGVGDVEVVIIDLFGWVGRRGSGGLWGGPGGVLRGRRGGRADVDRHRYRRVQQAQCFLLGVTSVAVLARDAIVNIVLSALPTVRGRGASGALAVVDIASLVELDGTVDPSYHVVSRVTFRALIVAVCHAGVVVHRNPGGVG